MTQPAATTKMTPILTQLCSQIVEAGKLATAPYILLPISGDKFVKLDVDTPDKILKHRWALFTMNKSEYASRYIKIDGKKTTISMHRELCFHHGLLVPGSKLQVDHINGDGLDNRMCNLRVCTANQNRWNRRKHSTRFTSKYIGISWSGINSKWKVGIKSKGKSKHLGYFSDEQEAAKAYDRAALELRGEFACLNFPKPTNPYADKLAKALMVMDEAMGSIEKYPSDDKILTQLGAEMWLQAQRESARKARARADAILKEGREGIPAEISIPHDGTGIIEG